MSTAIRSDTWAVSGSKVSFLSTGASTMVLRYGRSMVLVLETDQETDGRWISDASETLPGVMAYGDTREEAERHVKALAFEVLAERLEAGELQDVDGIVFQNR